MRKQATYLKIEIHLENNVFLNVQKKLSDTAAERNNFIMYTLEEHLWKNFGNKSLQSRLWT